MSKDVPDYGETMKPEPVGENAMARLNALAQRQHEAESEISRLEDALKVAKEQLRQVAERDLPELMDEVGMTEFTTSRGLKIRVQEYIRASIPKATIDQALAWLEEHGFDRLIKREFKIEFGKDEEAWARKFERDLARRKRPLHCAIKRAVHPQTLQSFIKEQLEEGVDMPLELFGAFRQRISKVEVKIEPKGGVEAKKMGKGRPKNQSPG